VTLLEPTAKLIDVVTRSIHFVCWNAAVCLSLCLAGRARAGLYYSGEPVAELPSQWRGFLLDQKALRMAGVKPAAGKPATPLRTRYEQAAAKLEEANRTRKLTAEESADLGALYVRLGEPAKAFAFLRQASREYPKSFHVVANLGTAAQLQGDLGQATTFLEEAVHLAPGKLQRAEELQLKLVRLRQRLPRDTQSLDDLFGVRFQTGDGSYQPGKLAIAEGKRLPHDAAALAQLLSLWLPADGRLLWQLAELANAEGDVRMAAAMMEGCVTEFGMSDPALRLHRRILRAAADALTKNDQTARALHAEHAAKSQARSKRPLLARLDADNSVPAAAGGSVPWAVLAETRVERGFKPVFPKYLQELAGKEIRLTGYVQPLGETLESSSFMLIEYPIGCWYCEMPDITGIVHVELAGGKTIEFDKKPITVLGKLKLNTANPEDFLFTLGEAKILD
jgi:hypothetical protein